MPVPSDTEATFLFADIAGFTALTEAHGDEQALQLVEEFAKAVRVELPRVGGEHVKTVGDALMLRVPDPGDAVRLALWITRNAMGGHQAPSVRVGGNYGSCSRTRRRLLRGDDQRRSAGVGASRRRRGARHRPHCGARP